MSGAALSPRARRDLAELYGGEAGERLAAALARRAEAFRAGHPRPATPPAERLDQNDVLLITYADQVRAPEQAPLRTLARLLRGPLAGTVSGVHLLPFYPATSDDGFSVADYREVDPAIGDWEAVRDLAGDHRLMLDAVINHVSASSRYVTGQLAGDPAYAGFVREEDPSRDLSGVVRPRTSPLLTPFRDAGGVTRHLWTTFSADQVDLDYRTPAVLEEVVDVLLGYVGQGAEILRLDAVTYLWKELGTGCASLPQTHAVLRVLRAVLEAAAPWTVMLTETNVPHEENVSYFGDGTDEAQMVYNFALPPLVLHTAVSGDASVLRAWAAELRTPGPDTAFLNFLASHDGVGLRPVEALLPPEDVAHLVDTVRGRGGLVSSRTAPGGEERPYELNVNYLDALTPALTPESATDAALAARRSLTAHAAMLALAGVPALYVHSLLGSRGAPGLAARTGRARSINRERLELAALEAELERPGSLRSQILSGFRRLLGVRRRHPAFHPQAGQRVLATPGAVFGVVREGRDDSAVWCLHNLGEAGVEVPADALPARAVDLLEGGEVDASDGLELGPWACRWLEAR